MTSNRVMITKMENIIHSRIIEFLKIKSYLTMLRIINPHFIIFSPSLITNLEINNKSETKNEMIVILQKNNFLQLFTTQSGCFSDCRTNDFM